MGKHPGGLRGETEGTHTGGFSESDTVPTQWTRGMGPARGQYGGQGVLGKPGVVG